jgi:hypothetical protein
MDVVASCWTETVGMALVGIESFHLLVLFIQFIPWR